MKTNKVLTFGAALIMCATVWGQSAIKKHSQTPAKEKQTQLTNTCGVTADFQNSTTCLGSTTYFYDSTTVTGQQTIISWKWHFGLPDTIHSYVQNPVYTFQDSGAFNVTLIVTSDQGCIDTIIKTIMVKNVHVSTTGINLSAAGAQDGSVTATVNQGNSPFVFVWSNNSSANSAQYTNTISGLSAGCYSVSVYDANGCSNSSSTCITEPQSGNCNLVATIDSIKNVCCFGFNDGSMTVFVSNGTGPYTYSWNTGATTMEHTGLSAGCYIVIVTDVNNCVDTASACITQPAQTGCNIAVSVFSATNVTTYGGSDGTVSVTASGGNGSYSYAWTGPGASTTVVQNTPTITGLIAGCYTVVVSDTTGCTATTVTCITQPPGATLNVTAENFNALSYCDSTNTTSSGYAWVTNGTPPYTYSWAPGGQTTMGISNLGIGCYTVVVTDANGATGTASKCVVQSTPIQFTPVVKNVNCFDSLSGEISLSGFTGGAAPFLISATNTTTNDSINGAWGTTVISNLPVGTYNVTVNDANGCQVTQLATINKVNCDSVWPGDANGDLTPNQYDLLPLGLGFGDTGPTRPGASIAWSGQACNDWTNNQPSGINYKHADCNGDGIINAADTTAIKLNYGQTHNKNNYSLPAGPNDPELAIVIPQDSAVGGTMVTGNIMLGTQAIPADVYGIAFSLEYDASIVVPGSFTADFSNNWIGNSSNTLTIQKDVYNSGKIDIAITRTDKQNVSGSGSIGTVSFILKDDVSGKDVVYNQLNIMPVNVVMIGNTGIQIPVNLTGDSIIGSTDVTGIENVVRSSSNLIVYPNPASSVINVTTGGETMEWIRITNIVGEEVYNNNVQNTTSVIDTNEMPAGTYYLQVKSTSGILVKPVVINR